MVCVWRLVVDKLGREKNFRFFLIEKESITVKFRFSIMGLR